MEQRAKKFYGSFVGACKDRFIEHIALLRARYELHAARRDEIGRRYADFGVEDFEESFFPRIDMHALEFFLVFSARKAIVATLVEIRTKYKRYKAAVTRLCQEDSFLWPREQALLTVAWIQVQEPERFLLSSLERSMEAQLADWPRDWRSGAVTWNPRVLDLIHAMMSGSLAKDWHKFDWWQGLEDTLRDRLLPRGLTVQDASNLIGLTLKHFFPEEMTAKHMPAAMRLRWRGEQKK